MPKVIANKLTGEVIPDTAENRIQTFRLEFGGRYREYCQKYETITYGNSFGCSSKELIEKYGLLEKHNEHIAQVRAHQEAEQKRRQEELASNVSMLNSIEAKKLLLELYTALDSYSQEEALGTIESYKDDARWCDIYR